MNDFGYVVLLKKSYRGDAARTRIEAGPRIF